MSDEQIIKALECCQTQYARNCKECPYERYQTHYISTTTCSSQMRRDLLDLINRQRAEISVKKKLLDKAETEIESLSKRNERQRLTIRAYHIGETKAEAIKEFAESIKLEFYREFDEIIPSIMADRIDNLVKEMTEGTE